jgi:uncharacterized protein with HEPN domain
MTRGDHDWLHDIIASCDLLAQYWSGADAREDPDPMLRDAIERRFEIMGEAVVRLSQESKELAPDVPWSSIKGLRNVVAHEYFRTDWRFLVEILESDELARLRSGCHSVLDAFDAQSHIDDPSEGSDDARSAYKAHTVPGRGLMADVDIDRSAALLDKMERDTET